MLKLIKRLVDLYWPECPECNGYGNTVEPVLDDGSGPSYPCWYCNQTGKAHYYRLFVSRGYRRVVNRV